MKRFLRCIKRIISPVLNLNHFNPINFFHYPKFLFDYFRYKSLSKEKLAIFDIYPVFEPKKAPQMSWNEYLIQDLWALEKILSSKVKHHIDVGSRLDGFVCQLAVSVKITYVDIRKPGFFHPNFNFVDGSILNLPFADKSISSLSSLHVVEHIGLGRYFDDLDPMGTIKALKELKRVVAIDGDLYLGVPVGRERVEFNANRILHPLTIYSIFSKDCELIEFAYAPKGESLRRFEDIDNFPEIDYAIGLFHFRHRST